MQQYGLQTGIFRCASAESLTVRSTARQPFCHSCCAPRRASYKWCGCCREGSADGQVGAAEAEVKEGTQGALMPGSAAADQRWEHKVELWKHPKVCSADSPCAAVDIYHAYLRHGA